MEVKQKNKQKHGPATPFQEGMRDGVPIALGYFAVAFTLGIAAKNAGLTPFQGLLASLLNNASAGEYAGFTVIAQNGAYWEIALMTLIANARYLLMSCALSQKFAPGEALGHRLLVGFDITDEIFGVTVARNGYLEPRYTYGAMAVSIPCWAAGTALGIALGNILPLRVGSALSVALFGMFLAVIVPPAKKDKVVAGLVLCGFLLSYLVSRAPFLAGISAGTKTILLTVLLASLGAIFFPVKNKEEKNEP